MQLATAKDAVELVGAIISIIAVTAGVAWSIFRAAYYKTVADERKELLEMKDSKFTELEKRFKALENRVTTLEAENALLKQLNLGLQGDKIRLQSDLDSSKKK